MYSLLWARFESLYNVNISLYIRNFDKNPGGSEVKASACKVGDLGSIPGSGRFPGEGNGTIFLKLIWLRSSCFWRSMPVNMLSHFSRVWLFATLWTVARQAPLSMEFSRQEDWSGLPFPSPGGLPDPGIKLKSPASPALAGIFFTTARPRKPEIECGEKNKVQHSE